MSKNEKVAVISDIHSNPKAFLNVLDDAEKQGCTRIICLGDIVGYGYDPNACIEICRDRNIECVLGNHDAGLVGKLSLEWFNSFAANAVLRQMDEVTDDNKEWLDSLDYNIREDFGAWSVCFAHATFSDPAEFGYINGPGDAVFESTIMSSGKCDVLFVGHTHYAETYAFDVDRNIFNFYTYNSPDLTINLNNYATTIINVGSVGYPRNQDGSFYCIFDVDEQMVHYRKLPFDFDSLINEMEKRNLTLPMWLKEKKGKINK